MEKQIELTREELDAVSGGYERQPAGSADHPYDREAKCCSCKALSWWNSAEKAPKVCPYCGGHWAYIRTGSF